MMKKAAKARAMDAVACRVADLEAVRIHMATVYGLQLHGLQTGAAATEYTKKPIGITHVSIQRLLPLSS
jgi:hypothetical protein